MTPHIEASKDEIAKIVIMPGDPLRASYIAKTYLDNYKLINEVRGMLGYTGYYKDKRVTVMASGMGIASMGIYSYELFKFYDVEEIIRVGSCGAYKRELDLYDLILATESFSWSSYAKMHNNYLEETISSSKDLNDKIINMALKNNLKLNKGRVHCSDVFYQDNIKPLDMYNNKQCLAVEMESFSLFYNALYLKKKATCVLTVSDNLITGLETTSYEREQNFKGMIELVLESIL